MTLRSKVYQTIKLKNGHLRSIIRVRHLRRKFQLRSLKVKPKITSYASIIAAGGVTDRRGLAATLLLCAQEINIPFGVVVHIPCRLFVLVRYFSLNILSCPVPSGLTTKRLDYKHGIAYANSCRAYLRQQFVLQLAFL